MMFLWNVTRAVLGGREPRYLLITKITTSHVLRIVPRENMSVRPRFPAEVLEVFVAARGRRRRARRGHAGSRLAASPKRPPPPSPGSWRSPAWAPAAPVLGAATAVSGRAPTTPPEAPLGPRGIVAFKVPCGV